MDKAELREVSDAELAFAAISPVSDEAWETIPVEIRGERMGDSLFGKRGKTEEIQHLFRLVDQIIGYSFFGDPMPEVRMIPREGVDPSKAWRLFQVQLQTRSCKHEVKIAALVWFLYSFYSHVWTAGNVPNFYSDAAELRKLDEDGSPSNDEAQVTELEDVKKAQLLAVNQRGDVTCKSCAEPWDRGVLSKDISAEQLLTYGLFLAPTKDDPCGESIMMSALATCPCCP